MKNFCYIRAALFAAAFALAASAASAGVTGSFAGFIRDANSHQPLKGAEVTLVGMNITATANKHGYFEINGLLPGIYEAAVTFPGYAKINLKKITIKPDFTTPANFDLILQAFHKEPIVIVSTRQPTNTGLTSSLHFVNGDDLQSRHFSDSFIDSFRYLPGIYGNHFRGGGSRDVLYLLDGMPMVSAMNRAPALNIPIAAIEEMVVYTGGFTAEYGNANAGIVNIIRKRGGPQFGLTARAFTDNIGLGGTRHDNLRSLQVGIGGPVSMSFGGPIVDMNYYISADLSATDTPYREQLNDTFDEAIQKNQNLSASYEIRFSRNLNVSLQTALSRWQWRSFEETSADPVSTLPLRENNRINTSLSLTHTVSPSMFYRLTVGHTRFDDSIEGSNIDTLQTVSFSNEIAPTIAFNLERAPWNQQIDERLSYVHAHLYKRFNNRVQLKAGFSGEYHDVAMNAQKIVAQPNYNRQESVNRFAFSKFSNDFQRFSYLASGYFESRITLSFLTAQLGVRADFFEPNVSNGGENGSDSEQSQPAPGSRGQLRISPRLGFSIPFSQSAFIYFNYGKFTQIPSLYHYYTGSGGAVSQQPLWPLLGNLDLEPSETTNYEVALRKNYGQNNHLQITGFYREYDELLDTNAFGPSRDLTKISVFVNKAYRRARGIELELIHDFSAKFSGQFMYAFTRSTGTSNGPEEGYNKLVRRGFNFDGEVETRLDWNQSHSLTTTGQARLGRVGISVASRIYSPREWSIETTTQKLALSYPLRNFFDLHVTYRTRSGKYRLSPFLEVRNLFDVRIRSQFDTHYRESNDDLLLFNSQPNLGFQEEFGRRIRLGMQLDF